MKKMIAVTAAFLVSCSALGMTAFAEENDETQVYVTISDANGNLVLVQDPVVVKDIDEDGELTINDALYIAHENSYEGGAAAGYSSSVGQYGLGMDKLWGTENGGSYGYYVNNSSAWSLADTVNNGDYVYAFVYTDLANWSDTYSFFDINNADKQQGDSLELTLNRFDWNAGNLPIEGAAITINGEDTQLTTDSDGKVTVTLDNAGKNIISAKSDSLTLVPPVVVVNVEGKNEDETTSTTTETTTTTTTTTTTKATTKAGNSPKTGDAGVGFAAVILGTAAAAAFTLRRRNED